MDCMIVPKPIFDREKEVRAYHLSFQVGNALLEEGKAHSIENSVSSPFLDFINETGLEVLTMNKFIFMPVTNVHLAIDLENFCEVERSLTVLMMNKKIYLSEANLQRLVRFKELGFKTAFYNFSDMNLLKDFLPYVDFMFCGNEETDIKPLLDLIKRGKYPTKLIAKNIDNDNIFDRADSYGIEFYEGRFYKTSKISSKNPVSPLKVSYIQLLNQVSQEDFDLVKFAKIVQRDTALAVQFLKMVNSSSIHSSKIRSLRHAAALLGQKEIKKWVSTALTSALGQGNPGEIIRLSMLRARFCENMASYFEMAIHKDNLYLMGLFSVLDVILETSMEDALNLVHIPDAIRKALLNENNDFGNVYHFIKSYEQGDWTEVSRVALIRNIKIENIFNAYNDALKWYGKMINSTLEEDIN